MHWFSHFTLRLTSFVLLLFVFSCAQQEDATTNDHHDPDSCCHAVLTIDVRDSATNDPLNGAIIEIEDSTSSHTVTAYHGSATLNNLCEGTYEIEVRYEHRQTEFTVTLGCNDTQSVTVNLGAIRDDGDHDDDDDGDDDNDHDTCCTASLRLRITDANHHDFGLDSTLVTLFQGHTTIASGTTDSSGYITFEGLCNNSTYTLTLTRDDYNHSTITFSTHECREYEEELRLQRH